MSSHGSKDRRASEAVPESGSKAAAEITTADQAALEAEPNWDRMGQIAKRLMATPPDPKVPAKSDAPRRPMLKQTGRTGGGGRPRVTT